jgi:hypothetical protein
MSRRNCNARRRFIPGEQSLAIEFGAPEIYVQHSQPGPGATWAFSLFYLYELAVLLIIFVLIFGAGLLRLG